MQARMKNPALIIAGSGKAIQELWGTVAASGLPPKTLALVHLRISMINGCSYCIDGGVRHARKDGESDDRLFAVAAWRDSPHFTAAERAALALAEAATRMSDQSDPVPDAVWNEAARHYDERGMAALVLGIATVNLFNRINVPTHQLPNADW